MNSKLFPLIPLAVTLVLAGCNSSSDSPSEKELPNFTSAPRDVRTINKDWSFQMDYASNDAIKADFNDSQWAQISIPHVWDVEDGQNGGDYYSGISTYRKDLSIKKIEQDKRYYLEFEGSALITKIYINEEYVGQHNGGFSRFRFDVTDYITQGNNQVAVQVDNRLSSMDTATNNFDRDTFLPLDAGADFTWWGGIYRDVNLLTLSDVSIDAEDFAGPGVYLSQKKVSEERAELDLDIYLANKSLSEFNGQAILVIKDDNDDIVIRRSLDVALEAESKKIINDSFAIDNPTLWQGRENPYLYKVFVQLVENGEVIDEVQQPLGIRSFAFDPDKGFILNGEEYPLRGVAMHQDWQDVGWATTKEQRKKNLDMIYDTGATTIRFSHYPHALDSQAYSDQLGFVNWSEIPMINALSLDQSYYDSAKEQLTAMIKQMYNHPSIGVWGITNEITVKNTVDPVDTANLIKKLSDYAHEIDGDVYRKTAQAAIKFDPIDSPLHEAVDLNAYNRYDGWYSGLTTDFGEFMDSFKAEHPGRVIGASEYGAGVSPDFHTDNPVATDHTEQFSQFFHESYLKQIEARPYIWATHVWNMFDFTATSRDEGDTKGRNDKGLVTLDREIKKDAYYLYQAAWSDEPMVHIASKEQESSTRSYIKAYSNLESLTLFIDGKEISTVSQADNDYRVAFEWKDLQLEHGQHAVEVVGQSGEKTLKDSFTFERIASTSNTLSSSLISVVVDENDGTGYLAHMPYNATLGQFKTIMQIPAGALISLEGKGADDELVIEAADIIVVTSESGEERRYTQKIDPTISYARPVTDNGSKGHLGPMDKQSNLVDNLDSTMLVLFNLAGNGLVEVDLQNIYYVDSITVSQGVAQQRFPGEQSFEIGTNVVAVDHQVVQTVNDWDQSSETWTIAREAKNVRLQFTDSKKMLTQGMYFPMLAQIKVYGGVIYSNTLDIDYVAREIDMSSSTSVTVGDLIKEINVLSQQTITLEVVDIADKLVTDDSNIIVPGYKVIANRIIQGLNYREIYTLK
ncbi:hypothetical protein L4D76_12860 [Photobacterium sagamiensis]|uniref:glycoside hydrolase family 2 protein n=1 Tax=Photobacterium sagamiensis TaxID=2910241 RepID=UPI003D0A438B